MLPLSTLSLRLTNREALTLEQASRAYELPALSTYWMPLDEPIEQWASFAQQHTEQRVPALTAVGHAFFALSHETRALRCFTLAYKHQQQHSRLPKDSDYWYNQAGRALLDATHHWSRAACALDTLTPDDLTADDLAEVRTMSRAARVQQERLWKLTDEVRAEIADWRERHLLPQRQQEEASR